MITYKDIELLREEDNPQKIAPQAGAQEDNLSLDVDILITGGNRGGGKTFMLCLEPKYDVDNPNFNGIIFRKEKGDLDGVIQTSHIIFDQDGKYNKSENLKYWQFNSGGRLRFNFFDSSIEDFKKRFQGHQYAYIGIDEITHIPYDKFRYLVTCNRNAHGIKNRIWGTCNPDPHSWVRTFIDWWIGEDGYPIPERDGVIRYCFMDGENPDDIYWGNSAQEVYDQCSNIIDRAYERANMAATGYGKEIFIKRVTFTRAELSENKKLLESDPSYVASISTSEEARQRNLYGNWNYKPSSQDFITDVDMNNMFNNAIQLGDKIRRITCDVAFQGGDALVMWLWVGNHIQDVFVCGQDSKTTIDIVRAKMREWRVLEENFCYDYQGLGQTFKGFFPQAMRFISQGAIEEEERGLYANEKSKCAYFFGLDLKDKKYSINSDILDIKMTGRNFSSMPLRNVLLTERKIIRFLEDSPKGKELIKKPEMKNIIGRSPDYMESLIMFKKFEFDKNKNKWIKPKGLGFI